MRITPTREEAKRAAAQGLFGRYATESVSFYDLAMWLNDLGIRNSFGERFQGRDIPPLLSDAAYLGYITFCKQRAGRFHHYANGKVEQLPEELRRTYTTYDPNDTIRSTRPDGQRWFEPMVDRATWDAVQKKLAGREKSAASPRSGSLYLSGLLVCAGCGKPMYARKDREEYYCSTYQKHRCEGRVADSPCLRNAVDHTDLEGYVNRYLQDVGKELDNLTTGCPSADYLTNAVIDLTDRSAAARTNATGKLEGDLHSTHDAYVDNYLRMLDYIRDNDPEGWAAMWEGLGDAHEPSVERAVEAYRRCFDPDGLKADIAKLEAEHDALMNDWRDLPTPRAKEKAKVELAALEDRIAELEKQQQDIGATVTAQWRQVLDLSRAVKEACAAMESEQGAHALRRRAEALRGLLVEIRCEFVVTGKGVGKQPGPGEARSRLSAVTFLPIAGDGRQYEAGDNDGNGGNGPDGNGGGSGNSGVTGGRNAAPNEGPARNRRPMPRSQENRR